MRMLYRLSFVVLCFVFGGSYSAVFAENNPKTCLPQFQRLDAKSWSATKKSLFNYGTMETAFTINAGDPIPFNNKPLIHGGAIKQKGLTLFKIEQKGHYYVSFSGAVLGTLLGVGNIQLRLNGNLIRAKTPGLTDDGVILLQEIIEVSKSNLPAEVEVVVTDDSMQFAAGDAVQINIIKLGS